MNSPTVNPELLNIARKQLNKYARDNYQEKSAFIAGGDPAMGADPSAPPQDPAAAAGGGAPPMDPAAGGAPPAGGGGPDIMASLQPMIQQAVQQAMQSQGGGMAAGGGGGAAGPGGTIKPKIDVNVEIMRMTKLLAKICDAMGIQIPASDMVATEQDLTQMAQGSGAAAQTGGGAAPASAIPAISPMGAASPDAAMGKAAEYIEQGTAITTSAQRAEKTANTAEAIMKLRRR